MPVHTIAALLDAPQDHLGQTVTIRGWVRTRRDAKAGLSFLQISDGSCFATMQVVAPGDLPNYQSDVLRMTSGASAIVTGEVVESRGKGQSIEVKATDIEVAGFVEDPDTYPITPKQHSFEYLREVAHLLRALLGRGRRDGGLRRPLNGLARCLVHGHRALARQRGEVGRERIGPRPIAARRLARGLLEPHRDRQQGQR